MEMHPKTLNYALILLQSKTMHKEELSMSDSEKALKKKIEQKAQQQQKRKTAEQTPGKASSKGGPTKVIFPIAVVYKLEVNVDKVIGLLDF